MTSANDLLHNMNSDRFAEVLGASPKNVREELFRAAGVKAKTGTFAVRSVNKNVVKAQKLHASMKGGFQINDELSEELIRNYLFTRRSLLGDALTKLDIEHDNGLTDEDLDVIVEELTPEQTEDLKAHLTEAHDDADVELYLHFMKFPGL